MLAAEAAWADDDPPELGVWRTWADSMTFYGAVLGGFFWYEQGIGSGAGPAGATKPHLPVRLVTCDDGRGGITIGAVESAGHQVRRAARGRFLDRLARLGLVCRGVLYVLIGGLALQISFGGQSREADDSGAIGTLASQPFGVVILWVMLVGFAALALWQLTEAVFGGAEALDRLEAAARTGFYGLLVVSLANLLVAGNQVESGDQHAQDLTAKALGLPAGQLLVAAGGLAIFAVGGYWAYKGVSRKFFRDLHTERMSSRARSVVGVLGLVGYGARGVVACLAGGFLLVAAIRYDPDQAKGLDATLRSFAETAVGPWLLTVVSLGLLVFAGYCFCEARWRRVSR